MSPVLVKHLMSSPVVSLFAEQTLPLADDIMRFKHIRHLPVIDDAGHLVGLVSHRDLLRAQISSLTGLDEGQRRARQEHVRVRELMTRDVWTVHAETLASVAGQTMAEHRYGCLPVIDQHQVLVGIITERDFLKFATKLIAMHD
jgi:CBS domain-containing membrane protein